MAETAKRRKQLTGMVTSAAMAKTITVMIETQTAHPAYKKRVRARMQVKAHDEQGLAREGDVVLVEATRPQSKTKRWRLLEVIHRAPGAAGEAK